MWSTGSHPEPSQLPPSSFAVTVDNTDGRLYLSRCKANRDANPDGWNGKGNHRTRKARVGANTLGYGFTVRTEGVHSGTAVHTMPEETDAVAAEISRLGYTVVSRNQSRLIIK